MRPKRVIRCNQKCPIRQFFGCASTANVFCWRPLSNCIDVASRVPKHFYGFECVVGQVVMNVKDPCISVFELFLSNFNFFKTFLFHIQREIECLYGQKVGRFLFFDCGIDFYHFLFHKRALPKKYFDFIGILFGLCQYEYREQNQRQQ